MKRTPAGPTLVVDEDFGPDSLMMEAIMIGTLGENKAGCVTLGDRILIAPAGSRVEAEDGGGWSVVIPQLGSFRRGEELRGSGGELGPPRDTLRAEWLDCLSPGAEPLFVVVNPLPAPPER